jgi:hypothetical protein
LKPLTVTVPATPSSRPSITGEVPLAPTAWLHTATASCKALFSQVKRMMASLLSFLRKKFYVVVLLGAVETMENPQNP